ncbi:uncharacterized protein ARMOST_15274 [Armillaria ostoyae]|uniref:Uncharacterized protein n=1 Tax=Armillaria ostoyae TaxID=47428 RepID=A0A284RSW5_ARMOS|nr:uncharacterized protein ARMOST_15274 [Armillaria ostoyae]
MPLFNNKKHFMQAYQEEPLLLHKGAFGARCDCQNRKLLLEVPHGSKAPENSTFPGRTTGWIHSDHEKKQTAAAANAQAVAASFAPKPAMPTPLPKIKKTPKTIKSKATVGLDTDLETIIIDEDVKMKATEENHIVQLAFGISQMSVNEDLPAKGATWGWATRKHRGWVSKHAATHSPAPVAAIDVLEKQDWILAERSNKHIHADVALMAHGGDLGDNQLVFPIAAWLNQFQLQLKYKSVQDALKLLSAEHV